MTETAEVGDFVTPDTSHNPQAHRRNNEYGFDDLAEKCKERPGQSMLAAEAISEKKARALHTRAGKRAPYLTEDGIVRISRRTVDRDTATGERTVNVYFTYEPFTDPIGA